LLLHELFLLYRACGNEYSKTIKASAVAFGGEVDFDDDWYDQNPVDDNSITKDNIIDIPIGLGFEFSQ